eukprot:Pompholyxophrys_sp_v1_NODE_135_length_1649_cov_17.881430.p3 type:complete len:128 gc:universal NODE_135_length_1649_cov_17.881430:750-1133(+)
MREATPVKLWNVAPWKFNSKKWLDLSTKSTLLLLSLINYFLLMRCQQTIEQCCGKEVGFCVEKDLCGEVFFAVESAYHSCLFWESMEFWKTFKPMELLIDICSLNVARNLLILGKFSSILDHILCGF